MYAHFYSNNAKVVQNILTVIGEKRHIEIKKKKNSKTGVGCNIRVAGTTRHTILLGAR